MSSSPNSPNPKDTLGNLLEIYNLLFAGERLQLQFPDEDAAERFRLKMTQFKSRQEKMLASIDAILKTEIQSFSFKYNVDNCSANMHFKDKPDARQYSFQIIRENTTVSEIATETPEEL